MDIQDFQKVFITGADKGLGFSLTSRFLQAGWQVFAGIYGTATNLQTLGKEHGSRLVFIPLDVTDMASVVAAWRQTLARTSALDILVNNAAVYLPPKPVKPLVELDLADGHLEMTMNVNTFGPLRNTQQFLPLLGRGRRKLIINISSEAGSIENCWRTSEYAYCMSKAALNMQSRILHNASPLAVSRCWLSIQAGCAQIWVVRKRISILMRLPRESIIWRTNHEPLEKPCIWTIWEIRFPGKGRTMDKKGILLLLGGAWHDFESFARTVKSLLESEGFCVHVTYDFEILTHLKELGYDLLLSYTCLGAPEVENSNAPVKFSEAQISALVQWVECGGSLLAVHAATVIGDSDTVLESLLGGAFISHPPQSIFQVIPLSAQHPITDGIEAFEVDDELYIERYHSSVTIHMIAIHKGFAYPVVWSQHFGLGWVAHISLGHSRKTWELKSYQQLILQTIHWMINY